MEFLRELLAKFEVEVEGAEKLENATQSLNEGGEAAEGFADDLSGMQVVALAAAAAVGGMAFAVYSFVESITAAVDETGKLSTTLGIQTDTIQKWGFVANEAGGAMSDVSSTMRRLSKNLFEAQRTAGPAREAFEKLGVAYEDDEHKLRNLEDVLLDAAVAIGKQTNNSEKLALAQETLGRGALKLIPGFKGTREEMEQALETAGDLNGLISQDFIKGAEAFNDNVGQMGNQFKALRAVIATALLPVVKFVVEGVRDMTSSISEWLRETQIIDRVVRFGGIASLGAAVKLMTTGLGGWVVNWRNIGLLISRAWVVLRPFVAAIAKFAIWAAILDDIIVFLTGGKSKLGDFIDEAFGIGAAAKVQRGFADAWELTVSWLDAADSSLDTFFESLANGDSVWEAATAAATEWAVSVGDFIRDNVGAELKAVFDLLTDIIETVTGGALQGIADTIFDAQDERLNREAALEAQDRESGRADRIRRFNAQRNQISENVARIQANTQNAGATPARSLTQVGATTNSMVDNSRVNVNLTGKQTPETVRAASAEAQKIAGTKRSRQRTANSVVRGT